VLGDAAICTKTAKDGFYALVSLPPGNAIVTETQPTGMNCSTTPDEVFLLLSAGQTAIVNFGDCNK
jgi:hypothetical protein